MKTGGYEIVDLKDVELTLDGDAVKIPGIYEVLEGSRKAKLLSGIVINDTTTETVTEADDRFVVFGLAGTSFVSQISIDNNVNLLTLTVTDEDMVSISKN